MLNYISEENLAFPGIHIDYLAFWREKYLLMTAMSETGKIKGSNCIYQSKAQIKGDKYKGLFSSAVEPTK